MTFTDRVDFVVPVYNEADTVLPLVDGISRAIAPRPHRIFLIDDGSTDGSGRRCDEAARSNPAVECVHFETNRGKTEALAEGFSRVQGPIVMTMDSDLQDDPDEIPRFLEALEGGLDLVVGWKADRHDPWRKRWASKVFNGFTARAFGLRLHDINCGFKAMRVEVARSLTLKRDYHRLIPVMAAARGYRVGEITVRHHARKHGKSKFGFERYWRGLRDTFQLWRELRAEKNSARR